MAVSVKMGVDASGFKAGIQEAQNSVKTLDAALKMNEKQLKATGDAEIYMANKSKLLNKQMEEQKKVVANIQKQMAAMKNAGVDETSEAYQKLERSMYNAAGKMMDIQTQLNGLANSEQNAAKGANEVSTSLNSINKKVSFDAVIKGIGSITGAMEKAAKAAVNLGKQIWDNITDSADWADTTATMATKLGMDVEDYQRHQKVFDTVADITVKDWQNAKQKIQKAVYDGSDEQMDIFRALGVGIREGGNPRYNNYKSKALREWEDVFWDTAQALRDKVASKELTQDQADVYANAIFGKGWADLSPIFALGREGFTQALEEQNVVSEESVNKLAELNDELVKLQGDFRDLKTEVLAGLAPALQGAAETLDGMLTRLMEYLQSPEGQAALEKMGEAVSGLFEDLGKIDPEQVVEGFTAVFDKVVSGLEWMVENKDTLSGLLTAIVIGWGGAKLTGGALQVLQLINGLKGLQGGGGGGGMTPTGDTGGVPTGGTGGATGTPALNIKGKIASALKGVGKFAVSGPGLALGGALIATAAVSNAVRDSATAKDDQTMEKIATAAEKLSNASEAARIGTELHGAIGYATDEKGRYITGFAGGRLLADPAAIEEALGTERGKGLWNAHDLNLLQAILPAETYTRLGQYYAFVDATTRQGMGIDEASSKFGGVTAADATSIAEEVFGAIANSLDEAAAKQDAAAQAMEDLPGAVAAAVESANITVVIQPEGSHANGLSYVPYDGYLGILHRGERIMTARENRNYTANSNLYVENMHMGGGTDAQALAAAIAAAQRRTLAGFGS